MELIVLSASIAPDRCQQDITLRSKESKNVHEVQEFQCLEENVINSNRRVFIRLVSNIVLIMLIKHSCEIWCPLNDMRRVKWDFFLLGCNSNKHSIPSSKYKVYFYLMSGNRAAVSFTGCTSSTVLQNLSFTIFLQIAPHTSVKTFFFNKWDFLKIFYYSMCSIGAFLIPISNLAVRGLIETR